VYRIDCQLVVGPSDLSRFLGCEHLTQQGLAAARGELERSERETLQRETLARRGLRHEPQHLRKFALPALRDRLLPELLSGELRVRRADTPDRAVI